MHLKNEHNLGAVGESGGKEKVKCELCDRKFADRWKMRGHMLLKHEIGHVECAQCSETFKNKTKLRNHEILVHLIKFKCDLCDEEFGLEGDLAAHKDVHHREFKCDQQGCGFKAKTEADLRNHMNQHYLESGQLWRIKRHIL